MYGQLSPPLYKCIHYTAKQLKCVLFFNNWSYLSFLGDSDPNLYYSWYLKVNLLTFTLLKYHGKKKNQQNSFNHFHKIQKRYSFKPAATSPNPFPLIDSDSVYSIPQFNYMLLYQFQNCNLPCDFLCCCWVGRTRGINFTKWHIGFNLRVRWEKKSVINWSDSKPWT